MKQQSMGTANHDESVDSSSGDGVTEVMIDDGENSFSFYEVWNHEIHVLKSAIDERIQSITERSQKEIERIAATVTGIAAPAPAPYKIKNVGPKIPPNQWTAHRAMMKQQYQQQQEQEQQRLLNSKPSPSKFSPINSIEPRMDLRTQSKSTKHRDLRLSPSGRSQTTATSDKTIPQSNLSSRPKQPNTIINVLSIPEESSLQQTTEEENENDVQEEMNDDENSEATGRSSQSETSSIHDVPVEVVSPLKETQSHHLAQTQKDVLVYEQPVDEEKKAESFDEDNAKEEQQESSGVIDETTRAIPSMIASMSLSSASRSEAGSPTNITGHAPVVPTPPTQSYRFFDTSKERQSRTLANGRCPRHFYPWAVERIRPQNGLRDAPTTAPTNGQCRPDAPASSKRKIQITTQPELQVEIENVMESVVVLSETSEGVNQVEALQATQENATKICDSSTNIQKVECFEQPFIEALPSEPSIEETLPSLTDKEVSVICRTETDAKTLDDDDVTNLSSNNGSKRRKHRKPPSPETFMMSGNRKMKRKKISKSPIKGESKVETNTDAQIPLFDSEEESTIDTSIKIEDKETATEAPSTAIISYNNDRRMQPQEGTVEPSLVRLEYVTERTMKDPYNDEGLYTGILILGKPETHGTMKYKDGRYYTGSWKRGRWNGHGKAIFANGDTYTGDYVHDQRHGVGRYEWSDARVYDGRFSNDQREGHGTYSWPNGSVYCGEFHLGLRHGYGTYTYEDGSVYTGEWRNGKQHGNGECIWADGRCFRGEWLDGHAHSGVEIRADGTIRHDGVWRKNRPVRPKVHHKKQERGHDPLLEIQPRKSFESDQSSKPNLESLRQGKSLVRNVSDTSGTMDESKKSKVGVRGIISASMSE